MAKNVNTIVSAVKFKLNSFSYKLYIVTEENKLLVLEQEGPIVELKDKVDLSKAKIIEDISDVSMLSYTSDYYSELLKLYIIKTDGTVWKMIDNAETDQYTIEKVNGIENCIMIHCGSEHIVALTENGSVFTWGNNEYGQLGDGTNESRETPERVQGLPKIIDIAVGPIHCMALSDNGRVYTWGSNFDGALGDGRYNKFTDAFDNDRGEYVRVFTEINDRSSPYQVEGLSDIVQITAGSCWSIALRNDGSVFEWGTRAITLPDHCNPIPQKVKISEKIVQVAAYSIVALALTDKGEVWEWGGILASLSEGMEPPRKLKGFPKTEKIVTGGITTFLTKDKGIWQSRSNDRYYNGKAVCIFSNKDLDKFNFK